MKGGIVASLACQPAVKRVLESTVRDRVGVRVGVVYASDAGRGQAQVG